MKGKALSQNAWCEILASDISLVASFMHSHSAGDVHSRVIGSTENIYENCDVKIMITGASRVRENESARLVRREEIIKGAYRFEGNLR